MARRGRLNQLIVWKRRSRAGKNISERFQGAFLTIEQPVTGSPSDRGILSCVKSDEAIIWLVSVKLKDVSGVLHAPNLVGRETFALLFEVLIETSNQK